MLRLYDTRRGQAEPLLPARRAQLRMYTCGPPGDGYAHAGHLRAYLLSDLVRRNAERHHLTVIACQAVTDAGHTASDSQIDRDGQVDDAEDQAPALAGPEGSTTPQRARRYEESFRADCTTLGIRPPDYSPRASESVALMTELIRRLIGSGHAYRTADGSVYFDAASFPGYGRLRGNPPGDLPPAHSGGGTEAGQRGRADWALWKGAPAGREPGWQAPWGSGFPGWHTGCSAMSLHDLGERIDVHIGGIGLLFPHHENVRAQSDSAAGREVVGHWVHAGEMLAGGRVMARANGNVVLLADLVRRGLDPLALRLACLEHRYREPVNLTWEALEAADRTLRRWRQRVAEWASSPSKPMCAEYSAEIAAAFDDDLDTPAALRTLAALERDGQIPAGSKFESFAHADQMLALDLASDIGRPRSSPPAAQ